MQLQEANETDTKKPRKRKRAAKSVLPKTESPGKQENQLPRSYSRNSQQSARPTRSIRRGANWPMSQPVSPLSDVSDDSDSDNLPAPPGASGFVASTSTALRNAKLVAEMDGLLKSADPHVKTTIRVQYPGRKAICTFDKPTYVRTGGHLCGLESMDLTPFEMAFLCHPVMELRQQMIDLLVSDYEGNDRELSFAEVVHHLRFVAQCQNAASLFPSGLVKGMRDKYAPFIENIHSVDDDEEDESRDEVSMSERKELCLAMLGQWCQLMRFAHLSKLTPAQVTSLIFALCRVAVDTYADATVRSHCSMAIDRMLEKRPAGVVDKIVYEFSLMFPSLDECTGAHLRVIKMFDSANGLRAHRLYFVALLISEVLGKAEQRGFFEILMIPQKPQTPPHRDEHRDLYGAFIELPTLLTVLQEKKFREDGTTAAFNVLAMLSDCVDSGLLHAQTKQGLQFLQERLETSMLLWNRLVCFDDELLRHMANILYERIRSVTNSKRGGDALRAVNEDSSDDDVGD